MPVTWWALLGFASGALSWTMAWVVYSTRPERAQNRLLALFLALAGASWFLFSGVAQVAPDPRFAWAAFITAMAAHIAAHGTHLQFLATLPSVLVRPLRGRAVRVGLAALFAAWLAHFILFAPQWMSGVAPLSVLYTWAWLPGPLFGQYWWLFDVLWWFGCAVSVTAFLNRRAWRDAKQAKAYLAAFTVHDGGFGLMLGVLLFAPPTTPWLLEFVLFAAWPLLNIWLTLLLAYGILRTQLFDIDVRVKATVQRSLVGGAFIVVFFAASEVAGNVFRSSFGPLVGLVAAAALALALAPLQRAADRVADKAIPGASGSAAYFEERKSEVYRAALEEALADGALTEKDRRVLRTLRERLGIEEVAAQALERDATASRAAA